MHTRNGKHRALSARYYNLASEEYASRHFLEVPWSLHVNRKALVEYFVDSGTKDEIGGTPWPECEVDLEVVAEARASDHSFNYEVTLGFSISVGGEEFKNYRLQLGDSKPARSSTVSWTITGPRPEFPFPLPRRCRLIFEGNLFDYSYATMVRNRINRSLRNLLLKLAKDDAAIQAAVLRFGNPAPECPDPHREANGPSI